MDQNDIQYVLEMLIDAKTEKNWDTIDEAIDTLKEFLDDDPFPEE